MQLGEKKKKQRRLGLQNNLIFSSVADMDGKPNFIKGVKLF